MSDVAVVVLAAGSGMRFGEPKQFLELTPGVRLVDAAVDSALEVSSKVVLVLPHGRQWDGIEVAEVVEGGDSRLESVARGLAALNGKTDVVLVHDAAHPLAPSTTFFELIEAISEGADAAVPLLPIADVVKGWDDSGKLVTLGRDGWGLAQVPMAFSMRALVAAHAHLESEGVEAWEDSELVEQNGGVVVAVAGSSSNIHVVTSEDLCVARALAKGVR